MVAGGVLGLVGNIVAGRANNIAQVIAGQAITGTGSSLLVRMPTALGFRVLTRIVQLLVIPTSMEIVAAQHRPMAQAFLAILNGIAAIIGLLEGQCARSGLTIDVTLLIRFF